MGTKITIVAAEQNSYNCLEENNIQVKKSIKIPVHYYTTNTKIGILDKLTARTTIRELVQYSDIEARTGLSYGLRDQCIDKVIWSWRSYKRLHGDWEKKAELATDKIGCARDDKEKEKTIGIPLNPSHYHLNQLKNVELDDFEIIKHKKKYYVHISITKLVENKPISSIGGIGQGLNISLAVVLLDASNPCVELLLDTTKRDLLDEYDEIISSIRHKRSNVAIYHECILANKTAELTEGSLIESVTHRSERRSSEEFEWR